MKIDGKWTTRHLHRLMYECFVGKVPEGYEVDHINDIRDDNRLDNFQLLTKSENNKKSYTSGNRNVSGQNNANSKLGTVAIKAIKSSTEMGITLAKRYGVTPSCISRLRRNL